MEYSISVSSEYIDKALLIAPGVQANDPAGATHVSPAYPSMQPLGLLARPMDPDDDGAAGALYMSDGGGGFVMPTTDPRGLAKVPPLKPGGTCLYSHPGGCLVFDGENGSLLVLVPNEDASKNHAISVDSAGSSIQLRHADGMGISITSGGKNSIVLNNAAGDAYVEINDDGITLNGNVKINGAVLCGNPASGQAVSLNQELVTLVAALKAGLTVPGFGLAQLSPAYPDPVGAATLSASPTP